MRKRDSAKFEAAACLRCRACLLRLFQLASRSVTESVSLSISCRLNLYASLFPNEDNGVRSERGSVTPFKSSS